MFRTVWLGGAALATRFASRFSRTRASRSSSTSRRRASRSGCERLPLDFYYDEEFEELPEAYQTLILDLLSGDQTLFVHADEVEAAWRLFTPILDNTLAVSFYAAGTWGSEGVRRT